MARNRNRQQPQQSKGQKMEDQVEKHEEDNVVEQFESGDNEVTGSDEDNVEDLQEDQDERKELQAAVESFEDPDPVSQRGRNNDEVALGDGGASVDLEDFRTMIHALLAGGVLPKDIRDTLNKELLGKTSRKTDNKTVTLTNNNFAKEKIATQAKGILECLASNGGEMTVEDLIEQLPGFISTVQTPQRIYQFYRKMLEEEGYIELS